MSNVVIDIDRVSFNYTDVPVLKDISLQIRAAEFIGIIGPNAGGKSTLLKLILGLLAPDTGTISRFNQAGKKDRAGRIGYVPQHVGFARDFPITVREAVLLGHVSARAMPFGYSRRQLAAAEQAMAALEIEALVNDHPDVVLSQVVGVPDERLVEVPALFVQCHDGATPTGRTLVDYCRERISRFKVPRYVVFVSEWPMSATKIQKFRLKELPLGEQYVV